MTHFERDVLTNHQSTNHLSISVSQYVANLTFELHGSHDSPTLAFGVGTTEKSNTWLCLAPVIYCWVIHPLLPFFINFVVLMLCAYIHWVVAFLMDSHWKNYYYYYWGMCVNACHGIWVVFRGPFFLHELVVPFHCLGPGDWCCSAWLTDHLTRPRTHLFIISSNSFCLQCLENLL